MSKLPPPPAPVGALVECRRVCDLLVIADSSIVLFRPATCAGRTWLERNCQAESWQWFGGALAVDVRYAGDIIEGACRDALVVHAT